MSTKIANLLGTFKKTGSTFTDGTRTFLITKRFNPKPKQSHEFILKKDQEHPDGKYISSVYWTSSNTANIDHQGIRYELKISDAEVTIKERG